jgi:hypothetical protein
MARPTLQLFGAAEVHGRIRDLQGPKFAKVVRGGLRKAAKVIEQAQKAATGIPDIKRAIGSRLLKQSKEGFGAKAGAAVGKKRSQLAKIAAKHQKKGKPGVGISSANIHWYVMGTKLRHTGETSRRNKMGRYNKPTGNPVHSTGRMPEHGFIRAASEAASGPATQVLHQEIRDGLEALWKEGKL